MNTHPNTILLCTLTPDGLARKTFRAILGEREADVMIGTTEYHIIVLESDYDESWQLAGREGDILVFDLVTYGYGEKLTWEALDKQKRELEAWAQDVCAKHQCSYAIYVTANYW